jgi:hypothetical protein
MSKTKHVDRRRRPGPEPRPLHQLGGPGPPSAGHEHRHRRDRKPGRPYTSVPELDANASAVRPINLKSDKNEVAIEGFWLPSNDAFGFASPTH